MNLSLYIQTFWHEGMTTSVPTPYCPPRLLPRIRSLHLKHMLLGLFILLSLRIFKYFPGMMLVDTLWLVVLCLYALFGYLSEKAMKRLGFSHLELFALLLMLLMPVYSAVAARLVFGQPLVYGILTQRGILFGLAALAITAKLRSRQLSLDDVEKTFVALGWGVLLLYLTMHFLLNPAEFAAYNGMVGGGSVEAYSFKFNDTFIVLMFFYYAFRGFREHRISCYLVAGIFFAFIVIVQGGRSGILSLMGAFALLVVRWGNRSKLMTFIPKAFIGVGLLLALLFVAVPTYMSDLVIRTGAAIDVVTTGQSGFDASANARITETALAVPYVKEHWIFGNGDISERWSDGYAGVMHGYFYPSDIGVLGVVFVYGAFGLLLFFSQFGFAWRAARRMRARALRTPLGDALIGFLLYTAVHSLATGGFVWNWESSLTMIAILHYLSKQVLAVPGRDGLDGSP